MESIEEQEFKRKKREQEEKVQKELAAKGREFDKQRREKKFNSDAISSSSFNFQDDNKETEKEKISSENKELVIGQKKENTIEEKDENKEEDNNSEKEKEIVKEKKKPKGGLKLTKRKNFG